MVKCVCGKTIDKIPSWLDSVTVDFVCNNCPKRQVKTISQLHAEQVAATKAAEMKDIDLGAEEEETEEEEGDL